MPGAGRGRGRGRPQCVASLFLEMISNASQGVINIHVNKSKAKQKEREREWEGVWRRQREHANCGHGPSWGLQLGRLTAVFLDSSSHNRPPPSLPPTAPPTATAHRTPLLPSNLKYAVNSRRERANCGGIYEPELLESARYISYPA